MSLTEKRVFEKKKKKTDVRDSIKCVQTVCSPSWGFSLKILYKPSYQFSMDPVPTLPPLDPSDVHCLRPCFRSPTSNKLLKFHLVTSMSGILLGALCSVGFIRFKSRRHKDPVLVVKSEIGPPLPPGTFLDFVFSFRVL